MYNRAAELIRIQQESRAGSNMSLLSQCLPSHTDQVSKSDPSRALVRSSRSLWFLAIDGLEGILALQHYRVSQKKFLIEFRSLLDQSAPGHIIIFFNIYACWTRKKMAIYCPQGSGTLRQQLLMMHGIAWYCRVLHCIAQYCTISHNLALSRTFLHYLALSCTISH